MIQIFYAFSYVKLVTYFYNHTKLKENSIALQNTQPEHFKVYSLSNLIFTIILQGRHYNPHVQNKKQS